MFSGSASFLAGHYSLASSVDPAPQMNGNIQKMISRSIEVAANSTSHMPSLGNDHG